jgi:hypothetical protein
MKKLVLKKDIVARINGGDMNRLRGGCGPDGFCDQYTIAHPDATCGHTCNGDPSCPGEETCVESCMGTCAWPCGALETVGGCFLSEMVCNTNGNTGCCGGIY